MKNKFKTIYLDLDGVCANWSLSACSCLGVEYPTNTKFKRWNWLEEFRHRDKINKCADTLEFWENLEKYPWSDKIVNLVNNSGYDWRFLTKPMKTPECFYGKAKWIFKHYPQHWDRLWIVTRSKALACTGEQDLLIDDTSKNIHQWKDVGGSTFFWEEMTPDYQNWEEQYNRLEKLINS